MNHEKLLIGVLILLYVIFPLPVLQDQDLSTYKYLSEENDLVTVPLRGLLFSVGLYLQVLPETVA